MEISGAETIQMLCATLFSLRENNKQCLISYIPNHVHYIYIFIDSCSMIISHSCGNDLIFCHIFYAFLKLYSLSCFTELYTNYIGPNSSSYSAL